MCDEWNDVKPMILEEAFVYSSSSYERPAQAAWLASTSASTANPSKALAALKRLELSAKLGS